MPALFAFGFSLAMSYSTVPMYRATTEVLVQAAPDPEQLSGETLVDASTLKNEERRAQGSAVQNQARAKVGNEPSLTANLLQDRDAKLLVFTAESRSPSRAADAANSYADAYVSTRRDELLRDFETRLAAQQAGLARAEESLAAMDADSAGADAQRMAIARYGTQIDDLETAIRLADDAGAAVINIAEAPNSPYSPRPVRSAVLSLLFGLLVGISAAYFRDMTDRHVRTPENLEKATGLSTSAVIPHLKGWGALETHIVSLEAPTSPEAEAYRALRARIQFRRVGQPLHTVMITSPRPGDGKSTTSVNLAIAFASAGEKTVLIDLDLRRPRIHRFLSLNNGRGISTLLLGGRLGDAIQEPPVVPNLSVVTAGPVDASTAEKLNDDRLEVVLNELKNRFDVVIIDTPPVLAVADPLTVAHHSDGVLLVVSASGTDRRDAALAANQLFEVGAPLVGAVLNNYSAAAAGYSYNYSYSNYEWTSDGDATESIPGLSPDAPGQVLEPSPDPAAPKLSRRQRRKLVKHASAETGVSGPATASEAAPVSEESMLATDASLLPEVTSPLLPPPDTTEHPLQAAIPEPIWGGDLSPDNAQEMFLTPSDRIDDVDATVALPDLRVSPEADEGDTDDVVRSGHTNALERLALIDAAFMTTNGISAQPDARSDPEMGPRTNSLDFENSHYVEVRPVVDAGGETFVSEEDLSSGEADVLLQVVDDTLDVGQAKSGAKKSAAKKSTTKKSAAKKSTTKKSAAKKSTTKKSAAKKSTAKKSAAKKSTAKKSAAKKSTAKKSTSKKSTSKK